MPRILLFTTLIMLSGCNNPVFSDGYQFGDITRATAGALAELQQAVVEYCASAQDSHLRQSALLIIRKHYPSVPDDGICALQHGGQ